MLSSRYSRNDSPRRESSIPRRRCHSDYDLSRQFQVKMAPECVSEHELTVILPQDPDNDDEDLQDEDHLTLLDPFFDLTHTRLKQLFSTFDSDADGIVTYQDFRQGLSVLGIECSDDEEFCAFIDQVDTDKSGGISQEEFEKAVQMIKLSSLFDPKTINQMKFLMHQDRFETAIIGIAEYSANRKRITKPLEDIQTFMFAPEPEWCNVRWISMEGVDMLNLRRLAIKYRLHPLALEDALQGERQRPKLEAYDEQFFLVLPLILPRNKEQILPYSRFYRKTLFRRTKKSDFDQKVKDLSAKLMDLQDIVMEPQQMSMYILKDTVVMVQEVKTDLWDIVVDRMKESYSKLRQSDATFLVYSILDALVDQLSPIMNAYGAQLILLDLQLLKIPKEFKIRSVQESLRQLTALRRTIKPLEKVVTQMIETLDGQKLYLRDVEDHVIQVIDECDTHIESAKALVEKFNALQAKRQNDVMGILTIIATVFLPLHFLTGVYGMNFQNMPELEWEYGYLLWWIVVVLFTALQYLGYLMLKNRFI